MRNSALAMNFTKIAEQIRNIRYVMEHLRALVLLTCDYNAPTDRYTAGGQPKQNSNLKACHFAE